MKRRGTPRKKNMRMRSEASIAAITKGTSKQTTLPSKTPRDGLRHDVTSSINLYTQFLIRRVGWWACAKR